MVITMVIIWLWWMIYVVIYIMIYDYRKPWFGNPPNRKPGFLWIFPTKRREKNPRNIHWNETGWWLTYPSEKYESHLGWFFSIYGKINSCSTPPTREKLVLTRSPLPPKQNQISNGLLGKSPAKHAACFSIQLGPVFFPEFHQSTINDHHPFRIIGCHQMVLIPLIHLMFNVTNPNGPINPKLDF